MTNAERRKLMQHTMFDSIAQQKAHGNYDYDEVRELPVVHIPAVPLRTVRGDCSWGCKLICYSSGVPDPTGFNYSGVGNSESIFEHLNHVDLSQARPGDIGVFGAHGEIHALMYYAWDKNRLWVWNWGTDGEPVFTTLGAEVAYHAGQPLTWCQVLRPDPTPHLRGNPRTKPPLAVSHSAPKETT